jgi:hypothetical protein
MRPQSILCELSGGGGFVPTPPHCYYCHLLTSIGLSTLKWFVCVYSGQYHVLTTYSRCIRRSRSTTETGTMGHQAKKVHTMSIWLDRLSNRWVHLYGQLRGESIAFAYILRADFAVHRHLIRSGILWRLQSRYIPASRRDNRSRVST